MKDLPFVEIVRLFQASQGMYLPDDKGNNISVPDGFDGRSLLTDDFVLTCLPGCFVGGIWTGKEAYVETGSAFMSVYDIETLQPELHDAGDVIFLTALHRFTLKESGVSTAAIPAIEVYQFKDGKIASLDFYYIESKSIDALTRKVSQSDE